MTTVELRGLHKSYRAKPPVHALSGIDLTVHSESLVAVLGPSGCGKTTMLRLIAGFERPDAGSIVIGDTEVASDSTMVAPERRHVTVVPQEGALFPHLDVADNVAFGLRRLPKAERAERVGSMLELVGLSGFERRRAEELSGGQQQRVALARALAPSPDVVLLDEPFTALDAGLRSAVRAEVATTLANAGATAILVTHDQAEAFAMASSVAVMRGGKIVQHDEPRALYQAPIDLETAQFVGDAILVSGTCRDDAVECVFGRVPTSTAHGHAPSGPVTVMIRPEQVLPRDDGVPAIVLSEQYQGHDSLVTLSVDGQTISARWPGTARYEPGSTVAVGILGAVVAYPGLLN